MEFRKDTADAFFKEKIFLQHNSPAATDSRYGWMALPTKLQIEGPIVIEERVGLYGGAYRGSSGAPGSHGLCTIGAFSYSASPLPARLVVGRYCSISTGLRFLDSHHHTHLLTTSAITFRPHNNLWRDLLEEQGVEPDPTWDIYGNKKFPVIGNDVWIGRDVTLSMGIIIGDGAIIAANSTVTKDVPPYTIVGGNPATLLRIRFPIDVVQRLQKVCWWDLDPKLVVRASVLPANQALDMFESCDSDFTPYKPRAIRLNGQGFEVISPD